MAVVVHVFLVGIFLWGNLAHVSKLSGPGVAVGLVFLSVPLLGLLGIFRRWRWSRIYNACLFGLWAIIWPLGIIAGSLRERNALLLLWGCIVFGLMLWLTLAFFRHSGVKEYFEKRTMQDLASNEMVRKAGDIFQTTTMKAAALGCTLILLAFLLILFILGPHFQQAAHRRSLGRGVQTIVELNWPKDDLYEDLAVASGNLAAGNVIFDRSVTLKYAGPYVIKMRTTTRPSSLLPESIRDPRVNIVITPPNGEHISTEIQELNSPYWGRDFGFILHWFDAPGEIPLDQPVHILVVVENPSEEFINFYGSDVVVALSRASSE